MSKTIYLIQTLHTEDEMLTGTKDIYGYIIKNNKFILIYRDTLENDTNVFKEIRMMLSQETYKDPNSMDYNEELINYIKNTKIDDIALKFL
jgi:hypothetical protein